VINIVIQHDAPSMTSGASHSLLGLLIQIKKNTDYNPIVILPVHGDIEKEFKKHSIEYYIFQQRDRWYRDINDKVTLITRIKDIVRPYIYKSDLVSIKRFLVSRKVQLVHVNMLPCGTVGEAAEALGIPVIWHIREFMEEDLNREFISKHKRIRIVNKANQIIAISNSIKNKFSSVFTKEIKVVYNGIDFNIKDINLDRKLLSKGVIDFSIIGRVTPNKGQYELIEALENLRKNRGLNYRLSIFGNIEDNHYWGKIQKYIEENDVNDRVLLKGYVTDVIDAIKEEDIVCVCSKQEAFGRVTIEGMLAGCLVIGANSGGTAELVIDGKTGFQYKQGDISSLSNVIWSAVSDPDRAIRIANNGQRYAINNFSVEHYADQIINIYKQYI